MNKNTETAILSIRLNSSLLVWFSSGILWVGFKDIQSHWFRTRQLPGLWLIFHLCPESLCECRGSKVPTRVLRESPCTSRCTSGTFLLVRLYICAFLFMCLYAGQRCLPSEHTIVPSPDIWKIQSVQALNKRPFENDDCLGSKEMAHLLLPPGSLKKLSTSSPRFVRIFSLSGADESNNLILNYLNLLTVRHPETS